VLAQVEVVSIDLEHVLGQILLDSPLIVPSLDEDLSLAFPLLENVPDYRKQNQEEVLDQEQHHDERYLRLLLRRPKLLQRKRYVVCMRGVCCIGSVPHSFEDAGGCIADECLKVGVAVDEVLPPFVHLGEEVDDLLRAKCKQQDILGNRAGTVMMLV
jgi:hypothetical protein